jgi:hypothetical protein
MDAIALPADQAVDDSPPSNFSTLLTRWVFRVDPWLQRVFEKRATIRDETTGALTDVTEWRTSCAGYDPTRMFSFTTARWHQWNDLPANVGLVVSNAVGVDRHLLWIGCSSKILGSHGFTMLSWVRYACPARKAV